MATKLLCPDCGGIIGEASPGEAACTCFPDTAEQSENAKSDTAALDSFLTKPVKRGEQLKRCIVCGKNLNGHRRVKDSRGYTCYSCAKDERAGEREGRIACKECRRLMKPGGLVAHEGKMICRKCWSEHQEKAQFKRKVSERNYKEHEWRSVIVLAVILAVLGALILYSFFKHHH